MTHPTAFTWDAEACVMVPKWPRLAAGRFTGCEDYLLAPVEPRSDASHRHEFAWLREAWKNLPEDMADEFPTPEHLRKWALIRAGYFNETLLDVGSNAAALRVASHLRARDDFAHVVVRGPLVVERTAKTGNDGYPPYNIEATADAGWRITLAVAGFGEDDLAITLESNQLVVRGRQPDDAGERVFLHRGIAARQFQRTFVLADGVEVTGAALENGLLHIELRRAAPETVVRAIPINGKTTA